MEFINVAGIQFRRAGRVYDFNAGNFTLRKGDQVVVETERGPSLGKVVELRYDKSEYYDLEKLKSIVRPASGKDLKQNDRLTPDYVQKFTQGKVDYYKLKMKLIHCEVQFDGGKVIIYFTAPGRVDFRDLVKSLASGLKTRVELKQIGARDETKLLGGIGICGREYCCSSFLREFVPVSIKMAKNQNLALNPKKVSGGCGRLLCCLTYEDEYYSKIRHVLPSRGSIVQVESGEKGKVLKVDFLNQRVEIENDLGHTEVVPASKVKVLKRGYQSDEDSDSWGDDLDPSLFEDDYGESNLDENVPGSKKNQKPRGPRGQSAGRSEGSRSGGGRDNHRGRSNSRGRDNRSKDNRGKENHRGSRQRKESPSPPDPNKKTGKPEPS